MSLSERLRDVEAAPWVIEEIKKFEMKIAALEKDAAMFLSEHDENVRLHFENVDLKELNARLREALTDLAEPILKPETYNGFDTTEAAINSFFNAVNSIARAALEGKE
jgi:hypothetical protein